MSGDLSNTVKWTMPVDLLPTEQKIRTEHIDNYKSEIYLLDEQQRNALGQPVQMHVIDIQDSASVNRAINTINSAKLKLQNIGKRHLGREMASRARNLGLTHTTTSETGQFVSSQDPSCGQHVIDIFTSDQMKKMLVEDPHSYFKMYYYAVLSVPLTDNYKKSAIEEFKRCHIPFLNTDQLTRLDQSKKRHCLMNLLGNPIAKHAPEVIRKVCKEHAEAYIVVKVTRKPKGSLTDTKDFVIESGYGDPGFLGGKCKLVTFGVPKLNENRYRLISLESELVRTSLKMEIPLTEAVESLRRNWDRQAKSVEGSRHTVLKGPTQLNGAESIPHRYETLLDPALASSPAAPSLAAHSPSMPSPPTLPASSPAAPSLATHRQSIPSPPPLHPPTTAKRSASKPSSASPGTDSFSSSTLDKLVNGDTTFEDIPEDDSITSLFGGSRSPASSTSKSQRASSPASESAKRAKVPTIILTGNDTFFRCRRCTYGICSKCKLEHDGGRKRGRSTSRRGRLGGGFSSSERADRLARLSQKQVKEGQCHLEVDDLEECEKTYFTEEQIEKHGTDHCHICKEYISVSKRR